MGVTGSEFPIWVGRAQKIPEGGLIEPEFTLQSYRRRDGLIVVNAKAAAGIVRGTVNEVDAAHHVMRDVVRQQLGRASFGGQVSLQWDAETQTRRYFASDRAKAIVAQVADTQNGLVGFEHIVDGDFEPTVPYNETDPFNNDEVYLIGGPDARTSYGSVRVLGSRALYYDQLETYFGAGLEDLTPALKDYMLAEEIVGGLVSPSSALMPS
jgi:hypothetical protein